MSAHICCSLPPLRSTYVWKNKDKMKSSLRKGVATPEPPAPLKVDVEKCHRHHCLPIGFKIPEDENHAPFEDVYFDTQEFDFLALDEPTWIIGRHFHSDGKWLWKLKSNTEFVQYASERLVYDERNFPSQQDLSNYLMHHYPSLSKKISFDTPYCKIRVNRYLMDAPGLCWVDVCRWVHGTQEYFYVVGTENARTLSSSSSEPTLFPNAPPAPSKIMVFLSTTFPNILSKFSSFEVELSRNQLIVHKKFPTEYLKSWDDLDEYFIYGRANDDFDSDSYGSDDNE